MKKKIWNVAIYEIVSDSSPSQIENLKEWISENNQDDILNLVGIYEDCDEPGSNFEREPFLRMKSDIEKNKINMVLVYDLSRFSRNYITATYYLEDYFKVNNIRFVSMSDDVDTENDVEDIVPLKNVISEMYKKECSQKIRNALTERMNRGSSIASKPPYGYKFEELYDTYNEKKIILVPCDDETPQIVKKIYDLYLSGYGFAKIATYLNNNGINPPSFRLKNFARNKFDLWSGNTVKTILTNPKYAGYMVQQTWKKVNYNDPKVELTNKDEWIYGGEFEGIIDKKTYKLVQDNINKRSKLKDKTSKNQEIQHPFSTVLKCGTCGGSMAYRKDYKGYKCSNSQRGGNRCKTHSIKEDYLISILKQSMLNNLNSIIDKEKCYEKISHIELDDNILEKEYNSIINELKQLDEDFKKMYSYKLLEVISEHNFNSVIESIQSNQENLRKRKNELIKDIEVKQNALQNTIPEQYKNKINEILNLNEIDRSFIEFFIDKIIVKYINEKDKKCEIYFKFEANKNKC